MISPRSSWPILRTITLVNHVRPLFFIAIIMAALPDILAAVSVSGSCSTPPQGLIDSYLQAPRWLNLTRLSESKSLVKANWFCELDPRWDGYLVSWSIAPLLRPDQRLFANAVDKEGTIVLDDKEHNHLYAVFVRWASCMIIARCSY